MSEPVFPQDFVQTCCPKVGEARRWYKTLAPDETINPSDYAECAFIKAGFGLKCENCGLFICEPPQTKADEFCSKIRQFYKQIKEYEDADKNCGAFI